MWKSPGSAPSGKRSAACMQSRTLPKRERAKVVSGKQFTPVLMKFRSVPLAGTVLLAGRVSAVLACTINRMKIESRSSQARAFMLRVKEIVGADAA